MRSIESSLFFSFGASRRNGAFWAVLIHLVRDDDDIGRVSGSNLSLQKSEVDEYISPRCIKLGSKLMEQDNQRRMISSTSLGSVFMVVEGNRDMGLLVADIVFILNWLNSRWSYFGFQLGVSKFSP